MTTTARQQAQESEQALTAVEGVKRVESTISPGVSITAVEMESDSDLGRAVDDARDAANILGSDRVIAGSDCGFDTFADFGAVDPEIAWA